MQHWYAVNTRPRLETLTMGGLERLRDRWELETYLPMLPESKIGRRIVPSTPLFPGYLFCRCDLEVMPVSVLAWTPGLRRIVGSERGPAIVPEDAIRLIQRRLQAIDKTGGLPNHPFHEGDVVEVTSGPLQGLMGVFQGPMGPAERVRVLIDFVGRANRVTIEPGLLQAVTQPPRRTRGRGRWLQGFDPGTKKQRP